MPERNGRPVAGGKTAQTGGSSAIRPERWGRPRKRTETFEQGNLSEPGGYMSRGVDGSWE